MSPFDGFGCCCSVTYCSCVMDGVTCLQHNFPIERQRRLSIFGKCGCEPHLSRTHQSHYHRGGPSGCGLYEDLVASHRFVDHSKMDLARSTVLAKDGVIQHCAGRRVSAKLARSTRISRKKRSRQACVPCPETVHKHQLSAREPLPVLWRANAQRDHGQHIPANLPSGLPHYDATDKVG